MTEVVAPLGGPPPGLMMGPDAPERIQRIEAARDALRIARTPPPPLPVEGPPLPPSFEEALIARAQFATANAPPPPPLPPPPVTPAPPSVDLWASETDDPLRGAASSYPSVGAPAGPREPTPPVFDSSAVDPNTEWRPDFAEEEAPAGPVVVDPARLAADPRSLFSADLIETLRTRHLGDVPLRSDVGATRLEP